MSRRGKFAFWTNNHLATPWTESNPGHTNCRAVKIATKLQELRVLLVACITIIYFKR